MKPEQISLRDLTEEDIPDIRNYWFRSPRDRIESMGVDFAKMPSESEFETSLVAKCRDNSVRKTSKLNALIILHDGRSVGFHTLNPVVEGDVGIFHAHVWDTAMRGQGLAMHTYPKACRIFFERFELQRIVFKTPIQNAAAIRVKEKLGIPYVGEEVIDFGIYRTGTRARVYELTRLQLERILS